MNINNQIRFTGVQNKNKGIYNQRFIDNANEAYAIPKDFWDNIKNKPKEKPFKDLVKYYLRDFVDTKLDRILELQRYYYSDNNIHYWQADTTNFNKSDNRIANPWASYITNLRVGRQFGRPIKYGYQNYVDENDDGSDILEAVKNFNRDNNESYHNRIMAINMFTTGRAYELFYIKEGTNIPKVTPIDPNSCFIVYSTDVDPIPLFAVRFYLVDIANTKKYYVEVYTDKNIYYFNVGDDIHGDFNLTREVEHKLSMMPMTEFENNPERMSIYERVLDKIDEFDVSESNMANSQEDFNNAMLVINGKLGNKNANAIPMTNNQNQKIYQDNVNGRKTLNDKDKNGKPNAPLFVRDTMNTKSNVFHVEPYTLRDGDKLQTIATSVSYLTKELNVAEWDTHRKDIASEIMQFTNTPNVTDENFANNTSGVALAYKLFGMDQEMQIPISLFTNGIHRRLNMLVDYLSIQPSSKIKNDDNYNLSDNVTITFIPSSPQNNQETVQNIQALNGTDAISKQTIQEMSTDITGIPQSQEEQRLQEESDNDKQRQLDFANQAYNQNKKVDDNDE